MAHERNWGKEEEGTVGIIYVCAQRLQRCVLCLNMKEIL